MSNRQLPVERRTISLPPAQASYVDRLVEEGTYGSVSEVMREGLRFIQARDAIIENWLRQEVLPTYHRVKADPSLITPAAEAFARIRNHAPPTRKAKINTRKTRV